MNLKMLKDREEKSGLPRLWLFVLLVVGALILGDLNQRMADARRLEEEAASLTEELEFLQDDIIQLLDEIENAGTEEYVEQWAHEDAKWVLPGEFIIIPVSDEAVEPDLGPPDDPNLPVMSNMEIWLKLLFGQ
jgi:cell division protein FtsB